MLGNLGPAHHIMTCHLWRVAWCAASSHILGIAEAMAVVSMPFNMARFNELPDINTAAKIDVSSAVEAVRAVIFNHGLSDSVSVTRTHNHFAVKAGEKAIAHAEPARGQIVITFRVPAEEEAHLIPYQWVWSKEKGECGGRR